MTATPRIFQSSFKKKASDSGVEVISMDDEAVFGPVLHKLSFGKAIEQDLLTDYQVVVVGIDNPSYSAMITERTLVKTDTDIQSDAQSFASHIGLAKAIKNYDLTRVISFHSRVSSARDFANKLPEVIEWMPSETKPDGELLTNHVSGAMPTNERNKNLQALGNITDDQRYILSNARCLSEGVDVPALDGVAFIDPRNSEIDIVQAVGRAIRLSKGKAIGSIVIPVFIEDHEDPDEVLNSSPFKKVWAVVNALRSHDEGLGEELDQLRQAIGKRGTVGKSDKIIFDLPTTITHQFETALKTKVIESTTASWEFWFGLLEIYKQEYGDCFLPSKHITASGFKLGGWVSNQRTHKEIMSPDRFKRLDDLGFVWDATAVLWERGFNELRAYKKENGNCIVSLRHNTSTPYALGYWLNTQRKNKRTISPDRIQRLDELGFIWDPTEEQWEQGFGKLSAYKEENGNCSTPQGHRTSTDFALGNWVSNQRHGKDSMDPVRVKRLDQLGFIWDPHEEYWEQCFNELATYKKKNGNCQIPKEHKTSTGSLLAAWMTMQRRAKNTMSADRIKRLDELGFIWDPMTEKWERGFNALSVYKKQNGNCMIHPKDKRSTGVSLGKWMARQRQVKNTLTPERLKRLDDLGFVWDPIGDQWENGFNELRTYKKESGNCVVPKGHMVSKDLNLGAWVSTQRSNRKTISPDRLKRLDDLGFVWDKYAEQWEQGFNELNAYKKENRDCWVPTKHKTSTGFALGSWVSQQRKVKETMSADRFKRLDDLGFVWARNKN